MNKKGSAGIIILIFILIVVITLIILNFTKYHWIGGNSETPEAPSIPKSLVRIDIIDADTKNSINSDLTVKQHGGGIIYKQEKDSDILTELSLTEGTYLIYGCVDDDNYYSKLIGQGIGNESETFNKRLDCKKVEKDINITHEGILENGNNTLRVDLNVENNLRNVFMCLDWNLGFVRAGLHNTKHLCPIGNWTTCYKYDSKDFSKCIETLPNPFYSCETSPPIVTECSSVYGNECEFFDLPIPQYLNGKTRQCTRLDEDIRNKTQGFEINYLANDLRTGDCLTIYVGDGDFDLERIDFFQRETFLSKYLFFVDNKDIKSPTKEYKVCKNN